MKSLQESFKLLSDELEAERRSHEATRNQLRDRDRAYSELENKLEAEKTRYQEELARIRTEFAYREDEVKRQCDKKVQTVVSEQI